MTSVLSAAERADLQGAARQIRQHVVTQARSLGQAYVGQGLQAADLMSVLFFRELDWHPDDPDSRDDFLLSVGHYAIALYAVLATCGTLDPDELASYGADGSRLTLGGEPGEVPGMGFAGGSLGQGLGVGAGQAYGWRLRNRPGRVFVYLSDGELQEGATWEAAMFAGAHGLDNLVALVDVNRTQADGELVLEVEPVGDKFRAFGWTAHTVDGHDLDAIASALDSTKSAASGPTVIVANTRLAEGAPSLQSRANAHFVRVGADQWDQVAAEVGGSR